MSTYDNELQEAIQRSMDDIIAEQNKPDDAKDKEVFDMMQHIRDTETPMPENKLEEAIWKKEEVEKPKKVEEPKKVSEPKKVKGPPPKPPSRPPQPGMKLKTFIRGGWVVKEWSY